jgi:hypothetical protein
VSVYARILRGAGATHRHWVAIEEEKCVGENFHALRAFCEERRLSLSRHGHSVVRDGALYQVFMFAEEEHAEIFRAEFGGERMHPSERGKGARWARWKKGPHQPTPERP